MCGRYLFDPDDYEKLITDPESPVLHFQGGEIRPTAAAPILQADNQIALARWGMEPTWGKTTLLHARSETVAEKPTFREAFAKNRCMIPTSGYYEWLHIAGKSQRGKKYFFYRPEGNRRLYLAGVALEGPEGPAFVIITRDAAPFMSEIHDRMPQTLEADQVQRWLKDTSYAQELLRLPQVALAKAYEGD